MNTRRLRHIASLFALCTSAALGQTPLGSAFTYQGEIRQSGSPATGAADLRFRLYTDAAAGSQIGAEIPLNGVTLSAGRFTASLDFGAAAFGADARWIEVDVRVPAGSGSFVTLSPRQRATPAPAARYAAESGSAANATQLNGQGPAFYQNAANLSGTIPAGLLAGSYTGAVTFGNASNSFAGSGAGLVGLSASNVGVGTLSDARLSSNVALLSGFQVFNGNKSFGAGLSTTAFALSTGPGAGRVLTSDATGNGTWQAPSVPMPLSLSGLDNTSLVTVQNSSTAVSARAFTAVMTPVAGAASSAAVFGQNLSTNASGIGVWGTHAGSGWGVYGQSVDGLGVIGVASGATASNSGVWGQTGSQNGRGVVGYATALSGNTSFGVMGQSDSTGGSGVYGYVPYGTGSSGILGKSDGANGTGVKGVATNGLYSAGVYGETTGGYGVWGNATASGGWGVYGQATTGPGVIGNSSSGKGVYGVSTTGHGVYGEASEINHAGVYGIGNGYGVYATGNVFGVYAETVGSFGTGVYGRGQDSGVYGYGINSGSYGVQGYVNSGTSNAGVRGTSAALNGNGIIAEAFTGASAYALWAKAPSGVGVFCQGGFQATGTKAFRIDHPADPENKYLLHYCSEGPEPLNVYRGNVETDGAGFAVVTLPSYFHEINRNLSYQLTVIDGGADFVLAKVVDEVKDNAFRIRTSKPFIRVSWQVTGVRNDLYTRRYGAPVEVEKTDKDRGTYQHPELYGQPKERMFGYEPVRTKE